MFPCIRFLISLSFCFLSVCSFSISLNRTASSLTLVFVSVSILANSFPSSNCLMSISSSNLLVIETSYSSRVVVLILNAPISASTSFILASLSFISFAILSFVLLLSPFESVTPLSNSCNWFSILLRLCASITVSSLTQIVFAYATGHHSLKLLSFPLGRCHLPC